MSKKTGSATDGKENQMSDPVSAETGVLEQTPDNSVATAEPEAPKKAPPEPAKGTKGTNNPRLGVERFLQLYPQSFYVACLLRSLYSYFIGTKDEWFALIDELLNRPVQYKKH